MPIPSFMTRPVAATWLLLPLCLAVPQAQANESYDLTFQGDGTFLILVMVFVIGLPHNAFLCKSAGY